MKTTAAETCSKHQVSLVGKWCGVLGEPAGAGSWVGGGLPSEEALGKPALLPQPAAWVRDGSWLRAKVIPFRLWDAFPEAQLQPLKLFCRLASWFLKWHRMCLHRWEILYLKPAAAQWESRIWEGHRGGQKGLFLLWPEGAYCCWCPNWKRNGRRLIIEMLLLLVFWTVGYSFPGVIMPASSSKDRGP